MSILDELYREWYAPKEKSTEESLREWEQNEILWELAEKSLDADLFQKLHESVFNQLDMEASREFQEGFCFGVQLMQFVHSSAGSEGQRMV